MAARKLMVLAASVLECHSASALAMPFIGARLSPPALVARSIGAQLASVDPAVWAAGAGVAATIRLQQEALVRMRLDEIRSGGNETGRFGLNLKALAAVPEGLVGWLQELGQDFPDELESLAGGVLARCAFQLLGVVFGVILFTCGGISWGFDGLKVWPRMNRIIVLAIIASAITFFDGNNDDIFIFPSLAALGFLASGRLFLRGAHALVLV